MAEPENKKTGFSGLDDLLDAPAPDQTPKTEKPAKTHAKAADPVTPESNTNQTKPTDAQLAELKILLTKINDSPKALKELTNDVLLLTDGSLPADQAEKVAHATWIKVVTNSVSKARDSASEENDVVQMLLKSHPSAITLEQAKKIFQVVKAKSPALLSQKPGQAQQTPSAHQPQQKKSEAPKKDSSSAKFFVVWAFVVISLVVAYNLKQSNEDKHTQYTSESSAPAEAAAPAADPPLAYEAAPPATDNIGAPPAASSPDWKLYDPDGKPWPQSTGYLKGFPKRHTDGLSNLTIDNSQNSSDVHVKLFYLSGDGGQEVRNAFIKAGSSFTMKKIRAGMYDVRYRDLEYGGLSKSEAFELEETPVEGGIQFSNMTMTLYKIANGNMQTQSISESQF